MNATESSSSSRMEIITTGAIFGTWHSGDILALLLIPGILPQSWQNMLVAWLHSLLSCFNRSMAIWFFEFRCSDFSKLSIALSLSPINKYASARLSKDLRNEEIFWLLTKISLCPAWKYWG